MDLPGYAIFRRPPRFLGTGNRDQTGRQGRTGRQGPNRKAGRQAEQAEQGTGYRLGRFINLSFG